MKTRILILIGMAAFSGILIFMYGVFAPLYSDLSECYFHDGDGNMQPCVIDKGPLLQYPIPPRELGFDEKTVKVEGKMADQICAIIEKGCHPFYHGNVRDDDSIMVGLIISDQEEIKHYQFLIHNETLSYNETVTKAEAACDPGPVLGDGYCYKDGQRVEFENEN